MRDLHAGTTTDLGVTDAQFVQMSGDGQHHRRTSASPVSTGRTHTVSVGPHGEPANAGSSGGSVSGDGRRIAFWSTATNLVDPVVGPHDVWLLQGSSSTLCGGCLTVT